jgi:antibiotic biosynthesis monooxygenase (ABM) superfamily enzyme
VSSSADQAPVVAHVVHALDAAGRDYFPEWIERAASVLSGYPGFRRIHQGVDVRDPDACHFLLEFDSLVELEAWSASEDHAALIALLDGFRVAPFRSEVLLMEPGVGRDPWHPTSASS